MLGNDSLDRHRRDRAGIRPGREVPPAGASGVRTDGIRWTNYRRLADARLSMRGHLVLLGPNDSGKRRVLRAVHLCRGVPGTQLSSSVQPRDLTSPDQPLVIGDVRSSLAYAPTDAPSHAVHADDVGVSPATELSNSPLAGAAVTVRDGHYVAPIAEQSDGVRRSPAGAHRSRPPTRRPPTSPAPLHQQIAEVRDDAVVGRRRLDLGKATGEPSSSGTPAHPGELHPQPAVGARSSRSGDVLCASGRERRGNGRGRPGRWPVRPPRPQRGGPGL